MNEFSDYGMLRDYERGLTINVADDRYSVFKEDEPKIEIKPISKDEFESYTENERRYYLTKLKRMFNVPQCEISLYFFGNKSSLSSYLSRKGPRGIFTNNKHGTRIYWKDADKENWYKFIGKESPKEKPSVSAKKEKEIILMGDGEMLCRMLNMAVTADKQYEITIKEL